MCNLSNLLALCIFSEARDQELQDPCFMVSVPFLNIICDVIRAA